MTDTLKTIQDTISTSQSEHSGSGWIIEHISNANYLDFSPFGRIYLPHLQLFGLDISITRHVFFMWIVSIILLVVGIYVARAYKKSLIPHGITNLFEVLVVFVRDEIAKPTIEKGYEKFLPFLLTAFFFILTCNFLGLVPYTATVTNNIAVTGILAIFSFFAIQIGGIINNGFIGYFKNLIPHGVPIFLAPIMFIVEFVGLFTKPFALAIRLFANMTAGHIVIYALISLIFVMQTILISPVSVGMALFIYLLEVLIALLQAYIFTMLSSLFIGMAVHQEH